MSYALGVDIGTSGVRTAVVDETGKRIASAECGHIAQDSDNKINASLWWDAVIACLKLQVESLGDIDPAGITKIAVAGTSGSMVLTDGNLVPASRALMYDSGGFTAEAGRINELAPDVHITRGESSALARAMRLVSESHGASHILHQADFITSRLIGTGGHSDFNNCLKLGFDPGSGEWPSWMEHIGINTRLLPEVHAPGDAIAPISESVAREIGLDTQVMVHAGTTDSIAAFLAAATDMTEGVAVTSLGSTLAVKILSRHRIDDANIGLYSHRLGDFWLAGGASNTGGRAIGQFFALAQIAELCNGIDPGKDSGFDYYPLVAPGERFPVADPHLAPRMTPRPDDDRLFLQGLFEGIARIEKRCYDAIAGMGGPKIANLKTAGGGSGNAVWTAIRERILEVSITSAGDTEAATGVAKLCLDKKR